jgi:hypothetical protein
MHRFSPLSSGVGASDNSTLMREAIVNSPNSSRTRPVGIATAFLKAALAHESLGVAVDLRTVWRIGIAIERLPRAVGPTPFRPPLWLRQQQVLPPGPTRA